MADAGLVYKNLRAVAPYMVRMRSRLKGEEGAPWTNYDTPFLVVARADIIGGLENHWAEPLFKGNTTHQPIVIHPSARDFGWTLNWTEMGPLWCSVNWLEAESGEWGVTSGLEWDYRDFAQFRNGELTPWRKTTDGFCRDGNLVDWAETVAAFSSYMEQCAPLYVRRPKVGL